MGLMESCTKNYGISNQWHREYFCEIARRRILESNCPQMQTLQVILAFISSGEYRFRRQRSSACALRHGARHLYHSLLHRRLRCPSRVRLHKLPGQLCQEEKSRQRGQAKGEPRQSRTVQARFFSTFSLKTQTISMPS